MLALVAVMVVIVTMLIAAPDAQAARPGSVQPGL